MNKKSRTWKTQEWERAYGSPERVTWVKSLPCVVAGCRSFGLCENAHVRGGGMSRKADARWIVPACRDHHAEMHRGQKTFAEKYGLDLEAIAGEIDERWNGSESQDLSH